MLPEAADVVGGDAAGGHIFRGGEDIGGQLVGGGKIVCAAAGNVAQRDLDPGPGKPGQRFVQGAVSAGAADQLVPAAVFFGKLRGVAPLCRDDGGHQVAAVHQRAYHLRDIAQGQFFAGYRIDNQHCRPQIVVHKLSL